MKKKLKIKFFIKFYLINNLILIIFFIFYLLNINKENYKEKFISIKLNIEKVYIIYNDLDIYYLNKLDNQTIKKIKRIKKISTNLINELNKINDKKLTPAYKIVKYDYLSYIYTILSEIELNKSKKITFLNKSYKNIKITKNLINKYKYEYKYQSKFKKNYPYKKLFLWLKKNNTEDRLNFLLAWNFSIKSIVFPNASYCDSALIEWSKISPIFKEKWPSTYNPSLKNCIK